MRHKQKIAIARLISDLIKSDDVICREEIAAYNRIVSGFDISVDELYEAQQFTMAEAMAVVKQMSVEDQRKLYSSLYDAAYSDKSCVVNEALLLQALSYMISEDKDRYAMLSRDMKGYQPADKYVIYLESEEMPAINEEISEQYDTIRNLLQLWNFEFIYIPKLSQSFSEMDKSYLFDILKYMNPRLSDEMLATLYDRMTTFTTESYTRDYLATYCQQDSFYDIEPTLLINMGTTHIPASDANLQDRYLINFLSIRLNYEPNCVLNEVKRFVDTYESYTTEAEFHRPKKCKNLFRYYGFYKQLFDFLARYHNNGVENGIQIDLRSHRIWMRGKEVPMSATHLATYIFILHQSFCTHYGGLIKAGQHHPLSEHDILRLGKSYHTICNLLRECPVSNERSYLDDVQNIRGYIARIRTTIENTIDALDRDYYYPKDTKDKDMYHIAINPARVRIKDAKGEYDFVDYPLWKEIKG